MRLNASADWRTIRLTNPELQKRPRASPSLAVTFRGEGSGQITARRDTLMIHRRTTLKLAAFAVAALLAGTAMASAESVLRRGNGAEPETIDPHKSTGVPENAI